MMDANTIISIIGVTISFVALIVSIFSGRKTKQLDQKLKQIELDRHVKESEESKKAVVEVGVVRTSSRQNNRLRFYNKGKAVARNVSFTIPSDDDNNIQLGMVDDYLPYPQLLPQQSFDICYVVYGDSPHQTIVITWEDDFSKDREAKVVVDM